MATKPSTDNNLFPLGTRSRIFPLRYSVACFLQTFEESETDQVGIAKDIIQCSLSYGHVIVVAYVLVG